jgi:dipeptidyl aminopeptidase/acylaminoacyl peptidase
MIRMWSRFSGVVLCVSAVALFEGASLTGAAGPVAAGRAPVAVAAPWNAAAADGTRFISEYDLFRFVWIADPEISPDGKQVAFVRVSVNKKHDGYDTALWIVPASGAEPPRALTSGPRDNSPRWSADGQQLAFVRAPEEDGKAQPPQIFLLSMAGGEARQVTRMPKGAGAPEWSPDGTRLAFTSTTQSKDFDKPATPPDNSDPAAEQKARKSDVRVITRAVYRANGGGYLDSTRHSAIWTLAVNEPDAKPQRITKGDFDVTVAAWSHDGREIYFTSTRVEEAYYEAPHRELYRVAADAPATAGQAPAGHAAAAHAAAAHDATAHDATARNAGTGADPTVLAQIDGSIGDVTVAPDGHGLAFNAVGHIRDQPRSYEQPDLFVAPIPTGRARNLTINFDYDIAGGLSADQHAPRGSQPSAPVWLDAHRVLTVVAREGRANLATVNVDTAAVAPLTTGDREVIAFTASGDASHVVALVSTTTSIGDLFTVNPATGALTRLTDLNKPLMNEIRLTDPEEISYPSFDGKKIQAWVQKPPDFDKTKKYPLILNIHGGPHSAYGYTFFHEMQLMAARGYVVLYPNPRGSTTYGQDFGNVIQYHYPGDDYKDLMAGVDELIKQGYIDDKRLGVTGGSGGGLLTNWVVTQTPRFAAAVSMRSISDWAGFWYTADFTLFQKTWFKGAPWEAPEDFASRSPITYVSKIKTPMMFIEGEQDFRTPPADGGEQLFRALKYMHVPTTMVQFPGESHELSRSGQPWHRVERLQHILGWFDKYLQGRPQQESY